MVQFAKDIDDGGNRPHRKSAKRRMTEQEMKDAWLARANPELQKKI